MDDLRFAGYEQEHGKDFGTTTLDNRTLRLSKQPSTGAGAAMHANNHINKTSSGVNSQIFKILKQDKGFKGLVWMMHGDTACCTGPIAMGAVWGNNLNRWFPSGAIKNAGVNVQGSHATHIRKVGLKSLAMIGHDYGRGDVAMGWGSGATEFPHPVTSQAGITTKATTIGITGSNLRVQNTNDQDLNAAKKAATGADIAIVSSTNDESFSSLETPPSPYYKAKGGSPPGLSYTTFGYSMLTVSAGSGLRRTAESEHCTWSVDDGDVLVVDSRSIDLEREPT
ncbi:hypothetical protein BJ742DRAFT_776173 [Cladochytrium replicatum]|nr:hypothetical protein BJ742DRAFT_776173 [Cladochytrium replicatum]